MSPTASPPIGTAPGGREPIPSPAGGAPPGVPPERPPFQSALETEWARTAIAEGQQQNRSQNTLSADGEPASPAEAFDRLPQGSEQPARRHSGLRGTSLDGARATAGSAPTVPGVTATPTTPTLPRRHCNAHHAHTPRRHCNAHHAHTPRRHSDAHHGTPGPDAH